MIVITEPNLAHFSKLFYSLQLINKTYLTLPKKVEHLKRYSQIQQVTHFRYCTSINQYNLQLT
jgi:hypothetical protein